MGFKSCQPRGGVYVERHDWRDGKITDSASKQIEFQQRLWKLLRLMVATILFGAGMAKAVNLTELVAANQLLGSLSLLLLVIGTETGIAVLVLRTSGPQSWVAVTLTFTIFGLVSGYALVTNSNCHCFGDQLGAWATFPLDLVILAACWYCRPPPPVRIAFPDFRTIALPVVIAILFVGFAHQNHRVNVANGSQNLDFLVADMLMGQQWPLSHSQHSLLEEMHQGAGRSKRLRPLSQSSRTTVR